MITKSSFLTLENCLLSSDAQPVLYNLSIKENEWKMKLHLKCTNGQIPYLKLTLFSHFGSVIFHSILSPLLLSNCCWMIALRLNNFWCQAHLNVVALLNLMVLSTLPSKIMNFKALPTPKKQKNHFGDRSKRHNLMIWESCETHLSWQSNLSISSTRNERWF